MQKFINTAKPITQPKWGKEFRPGEYRYDEVSPYLFQWGRCLQALVSQTLSFEFSGEFHERECGIYKCEGGCYVPGGGELVLRDNYCSWDNDGTTKESDKKLVKAADLITRIVLEWDPMRPVDSMMETCADWLKMPLEAFKLGTEKARCGGVFGSNALSDFFRWNPFSEPPYKQDYRRFCMVNFGDMTEAEVDQMFADEALGKELLEEMQALCRKAAGGAYVSAPMCCSPRRLVPKDGAEDAPDSLHFWINTGRSTQIDGWKTEAEIRAFLAGNGVLIDKMCE